MEKRGRRGEPEEDFDEAQCFKTQLLLAGPLLAVILWVFYCVISLSLQKAREGS